MTEATPADAPLYILGVKAERFMFVDVMDVVVSTSGLTQFTGSNGNGKTDALTALEATLLGRDSIPKMPVQTGAERAETEVPIGGADGKPLFYAKRVYRDGGKNSLEVRPAGGGKDFPSPQGVLDALVDARFTNPVKFANPGRGTERANNEYRLEVLFGLCPLPIDLAAHDAAMDVLEKEKTPVGRRIKELEAVVKDAVASSTPAGDLEDEAPIVTQIAQLDNAGEMRARAATRNAELKKEVEEIESRVKRMKAEIVDLEAKAELLAKEWARQGQLAMSPKEDPAPVLRVKLAGVRERNEARRTSVVDRTRAEERAKQLLAEKGRAVEIELKLKDMKDVRENAIIAAKFPLKNLTISSDGWLSVKKETGVVPFHQENTAKRILAAFVIFAQTKPKLRAFIIKDGGNDLDHDSMMMLSAMSKKFNIPTFIEVRIGDPEAGAIIEFRNGNVVPPAAPGAAS